MKWFNRPSVIKGLIFDMDNTLYSHPAYTSHQEEVLVARLAAERGEELTLTQAVVDRWRKDFATAHGGRQPSLGNTFKGLGIPIETSIRWREECIQPERFLTPDTDLFRALGILGGAFALSVVTNNPVNTAKRTFRALGLEGVFTHIVGLDTFGISKPAPRAFAHAAEIMGCQPDTVLSIGDRYEIDLEPALTLGMGGLLIEHVQEVRSLPGILLAK